MKKYNIGFIIGAIVFGSIGVYASIKYQASEIEYNNETLDNVLDELYNVTNKEVINKITIHLCTKHNANLNYGGNTIISFNESLINAYDYFKIYNYSQNEYVSSCSVRASQKNSGAISLTSYIKYNIDDDSSVWINLLKNNNNSNVDAQCCYDFDFYNE